MTRRNLPNQRKAYKDLNNRLNGYAKKVVAIFSMLASETASFVGTNNYTGEKPFRFNEFAKKDVNKLFSTFRNSLQTLILNGMTDEWSKSNTFQDTLADKVVKSFSKTNESQRNKWYATDNGVLQSLLSRKVDGRSLNQRISRLVPVVQAILEIAISVGITKSKSVSVLGKRIALYLNDWRTLAKDYKKIYKKTLDVPSSEYLAVRLAKNEICLAYRTAEQYRWSNMDFIIGKSIRTSKGKHHKEDICDELAGDYPKDFRWTGWHINCMCYSVPLVMEEKQFSGSRTLKELSIRKGDTAMPTAFTVWLNDYCNNHLDSLSYPNFIVDNECFISDKKILKSIHNIQYLQLINNKDYAVVKRNDAGGLFAIHKGHKVHNDKKVFFNNTMNSDDLEMEFALKAFDEGHS